MSKVRNAFFMLSIAMLWAVSPASGLMPQDFEATIKVEPATATIKVSGRYLGDGASGKRKKLSFLQAGIGMPELANRVCGLALADGGGRAVRYNTSAAGEFAAEQEFNGWSYEIKAGAPANPRASAHVSWVRDTTGILLLDDLLPQSPNARAKVVINLPDRWRVVSAEKSIGPNTFEISNIEKAVFIVGNDLRETRVSVGTSELHIATTGQWFFNDADAAALTSEVYAEYLRIFGFAPNQNLQIAILPFPQKDIQKGTWEAETRGPSVTIVSADMPFKSQSPQRLHEQLRHEIFHFWIPNGVNLTGNYDWFYEGFALYQSLKTGVALNKLTFDNFLDTLSRAHNIDSAQSRRVSLIEASQNRWNGADTQVYARGMAVAFLFDLALLQNSNVRNNVSDIFQKLYVQHRKPAAATDANTAIFRVLQMYPPLSDHLTDRYIKGPQKIDWQIQLASAGIENEPGNSRTNLRVMSKLNGRQKAVLDKLGYNNWRKLTRK